MSDPIGRETTGEAATAAEARALGGLRPAWGPPMMMRVRADQLRVGDIIMVEDDEGLGGDGVQLTETPTFPGGDAATGWFSGTTIDGGPERILMEAGTRCAIVRVLPVDPPAYEVQLAASAVVKAWADEGRVPSHHRMVRANLWRSWPAMAQAVSNLVKASKSAGGR